MAIRAGKATDTLLPAITSISSFDKKWGVGYGYFDYAGHLGRIESAFGSGKILARLYVEEKSRSTSNVWNVITDFLTVFGISDIGCVYPEYENRNLSDVALHFLSSINKSLSRFSQNARDDVRRKIIRSLHNNFSGHGLIPTKSEAISFMNVFKMGNSILKARYFPNKINLFDIEYNEYPEHKYYPNLDSSFIDIICDIIESSIPAGDYTSKFRSFIPPVDLDIKVYQSNLIPIDNIKRPDDGIYRITLDSDVEAIRIVSKSGRSRVAEDPRMLGVCIRRIVLNGTDVPMDSENFREGFYPVESHGDQMWRWTSGDAVFLITSSKIAQMIEIHVTDWHGTLTNYS